jgi:nucleoside-diphosphate-sugar epimerase
MPRALIVGCGYLGREVARRLFAQGWDVTAWTQSAESAAALGDNAFRVSAVDVSELDFVRKTGNREGALDWVIFCVSTKGGDVEKYRHVYLNGAANLIRGLCFGRLVFTSSTSVFGQMDGSTVTEETPVSPTTDTAKILAETEEIVLARNGVVARLAGIYGPGRCALLSQFQTGRVTAPNDRLLNTIHRDDAAAAILKMLDSTEGTGIYHVADDGGVTHRQAVDFLIEKLGLPEAASPSENPRRGHTNKRISNAKLRSLGWQPRFATFLDGLTTLLGK